MGLDFILFGVPRSGTTPAAEALNLHPQIMCGVEYFPDFQSACSSPIPSAFADKRFRHSPNCDLTREIYLRKSGQARKFGNKDPRFSFYCNDFSSALPACKKICIYRTHLTFWNSWDFRANNPRDKYWERGQTGLFALLELVCLLGTISDLQAAGEVLLVNYDALFFGDPSILEMIYDYIGVEPNADAVAQFRQTLFSPADLVRRKTTDDVARLYKTMELGSLEEALFRKPVVTNREVADYLVEYLHLARPKVTSLIDSRFPDLSVRQWIYFLGARPLRETLVRIGIQGRVQRGIGQDEGLIERMRLGLIQLQRRLEG